MNEQNTKTDCGALFLFAAIMVLWSVTAVARWITSSITQPTPTAPNYVVGVPLEIMHDGLRYRVIANDELKSLGSEITSLTNRMDAVDGGIQKEYSCDETMYFVVRGNPKIPKVVVRTIGFETPKQLGYSNCELIPKSLWSVVGNPIN